MKSLTLPPAIGAAIERFRAEVAKRYGARLREVVLFGSWARGNANQKSDIDLLVVVDDLTDRERRDLLDLAFDIGSADQEHLIITPLVYSTEQAEDMRVRERRLMREIALDGIPV